MTRYLDPCQNQIHLLRVNCEMREVILPMPSTEWGESCPSLCIYCSYSKPVSKSPEAKIRTLLSSPCLSQGILLDSKTLFLIYSFDDFCITYPNICSFHERSHSVSFVVHSIVLFFPQVFLLYGTFKINGRFTYFQVNKTAHHMPLQVPAYVRICLGQSESACFAMFLLPRCIFRCRRENLTTRV